MTRRVLQIARLVLACALLGACADDEPRSAAEPAREFIAQRSDFADFETWKVFTLGDDAEAHASAAKPQARVRVYVSELPAPGAKAFAQGTLIVKAVELGDPRDWTIHAMAKRGGTFNRTGAHGWEFFELVKNADLDTVIAWRGHGPPRGSGYGASNEGDEDAGSDDAGAAMELDCNGCHLHTDNDAVNSAPLQLPFER